MPLSFHEIIHKLSDPAPTRRREALVQLEHEDKDTIKRFAAQARDLNLSACLELCNTLAGANSEPLVDLLGYYARRSENSLRERALTALANTPAEVRGKCLLKLLEAPSADVRSSACELIGKSGMISARSSLINCFSDRNDKVVIAATSALERLNCSDASEDITQLLEHSSSDVRIAALNVLVHLAPDHGFPFGEVMRLAESDHYFSVRIAACWALHKRPSVKLMEPLLKLFKSNIEAELRGATAMALAEYPNEEVIRALLEAEASDNSPAVCLSSRRALNKMPEEKLLAVCSDILEHEDESIRMQVASTLGGLRFDNAADTLIERLNLEENELVKASIIEALGNGGWTKAWPILRGLVNSDYMLAYPASYALSELLDEEHVEDFAIILSSVKEETVQEAMLRRFMLYSKSNGVPVTLYPFMEKFFDHENPKFAVFALNIISCMEGEGLAGKIIPVLRSFKDDEAIQVGAQAVFTTAGKSVWEIFKQAEEEYMPELEIVIQQIGQLGENGETLLAELAGMASSGRSSTVSCLNTAMKIAPYLINEAIDKCDDSSIERLLQAWKKLSEEVRQKSGFDYWHLLSSESAEVRFAVLECLSGEPNDRLLIKITELAISDPNEKVRASARETTRRMVLENYSGAS